jgi:UDP-3-O-acyl-N-acetylglucosamine deacetylase
VIKGDQIMNPEGARFRDEMGRHKVLDLIGDLTLIGMPILGHIISIRSGHSSNIAFAKLIEAAYRRRQTTSTAQIEAPRMVAAQSECRG